MIKRSALPVLKRFLGTDDGLQIKVCSNYTVIHDTVAVYFC